jgi:hypothetical protein
MLHAGIASCLDWQFGGMLVGWWLVLGHVIVYYILSTISSSFLSWPEHASL